MVPIIAEIFIPENITANQYQYSGKDKFKT
jgi:hypothetical protein